MNRLAQRGRTGRGLPAALDHPEQRWCPVSSATWGESSRPARDTRGKGECVERGTVPGKRSRRSHCRPVEVSSTVSPVHSDEDDDSWLGCRPLRGLACRNSHVRRTHQSGDSHRYARSTTRLPIMLLTNNNTRVHLSSNTNPILQSNTIYV